MYFNASENLVNKSWGGGLNELKEIDEFLYSLRGNSFLLENAIGLLNIGEDNIKKLLNHYRKEGLITEQKVLLCPNDRAVLEVNNEDIHLYCFICEEVFKADDCDVGTEYRVDLDESRLTSPKIVISDDGSPDKPVIDIKPGINRTNGHKVLEPQMGNKRFLDKTDRDWLIEKIANLNRFQTQGGRRNLLIQAEIPDKWINEIKLDEGGVSNVAQNVVYDLETRDYLSSNKHPLGSLLEVLLDSLGYYDSIKVVAIIFRYQLEHDKNKKNRLSSKYGVPLADVEGDNYKRHREPEETLPSGLDVDEFKEQLEALYYNGKENWKDITFLEQGAKAARAVCRLEWNHNGEGTGFLVGPDLILTNFHVLKSQEEDDLGQRLQDCRVRFGAVKMEDGGISPGSDFVRLSQQNRLIKYSPIEDLDFALLRLDKPVEDGLRVQRANLAQNPINIKQFANIIQHPYGGEMKVSLRYNQVIDIRPKRIIYISDTKSGSSGAPVFNDHWEVVALHRSSVLKDENGILIRKGNVGIPIHEILSEIKQYLRE